MMKVGSIMTSDLLIKLCGHRLYSVSPSLDQLTDESATNQIGRSWFWGALSGNLLYRGDTQVSTCRRHMHMQGQRRCCVPWAGHIWWRDSHYSTWRDGMRLSENPCWVCQHNHDLSYYFDHTESDLVSINPIGEIKFSIGDGDEVRHNKTSIDSLYSCTDEQRRRPLTWGGWSWVCVWCFVV